MCWEYTLFEAFIRYSTLACQAVGIAQKTWIDWKNKDRRLQDAVNRARGGKISEWISNIDQAAKKDWKASQALLQAASETRDEFGKQGSGDNKIEVIINIDRSQGVTIDGKSTEQGATSVIIDQEPKGEIIDPAEDESDVQVIEAGDNEAA